MNTLSTLPPTYFKRPGSAPTVMIVGAGPIGLSLAILLKKWGVSLRIIEKNAGPSTATKAMAIHSRTLEIFRDLGIADQAVSAGFTINQFSVQSNARRVLNYNFSYLDATYPLLLSLPQPQTEKLLLERLNELGTQVEWNTELVDLENQPDAVRMTLRHADGSDETLTTRWVAACDGARSNIRKRLDMTFEGSSYDRFFMLADADIQWSGSKDEGAFFLGAQDGYVAVAPISAESRYRLFIEMPYNLPPEGERPSLSLENFQRLCEGRGQKMTLSNISSTTIASFQHRRVQSMQQGSVFLVGDSAHIGSPIGGQWMNLGVSEAYNLAWKMAYVDQGLADPSLLDSYNDERYPVALEVENTAHRLTGLITVRQRALVWLRDNVLPLLSNRKKVQRKLPSMISGHQYHYGKSDYIQESLTKKQRKDWRRKGKKAEFPTAAPRAGQLAPDVELWQRQGLPPKRLIDLFHGTFTLLVFTGADQFSPLLPGHYSLARTVEKDYPGIKAYCVVDALSSDGLPSWHSTLLDPDWRLHKRYHAMEGTLMLVRPDGYIAFQGADAMSLVTYLNLRSGLLKGAIRTIPSEVDTVELQL
ncbi:FAD-dependent monooxygenase [Pseudomonas citrulli]|uniref:FAD-dependent monooxygenase n=1 Tax=Pseudomonas citrulli TaxID=3064347 RepID=A0ABT9BYC8_9PSED|nr:FAD-dependent monooxygenase [Pseudomonas sp. K18]MDO7895947.1 FAD-dependent monooxygenase [Pseudomonas sp. K18]